MYDRVVDVPRLLCFYDEDEQLPDETLVSAKAALDAHYAAELGEPFRTAGLCLYRDGRDSVAWHGDRIGRGNTHDTMVAIISLGAPAPCCCARPPAACRPCGTRSGTATSS
jgi:alkylated DNA repair dioxygenase AlkB